MSRRAQMFRAAAVLFSIVNLLGIGYALAMNEGLHGALHAGLLLGTGVVWALLSTKGTTNLGSASRDAQLEHLQQSLDAVAVEVERIGEAQRFTTKLQAERTRSSL